MFKVKHNVFLLILLGLFPDMKLTNSCSNLFTYCLLGVSRTLTLHRWVYSDCNILFTAVILPKAEICLFDHCKTYFCIPSNLLSKFNCSLSFKFGVYKQHQIYIVNDCLVHIRSVLSHNVSNKPILKPIQIAILLLIFGFNPENLNNWKRKSRFFLNHLNQYCIVRSW